MTEQHDFSGIDQMTRGDARQARDLRATMAVIARRTDDPDLRALVVDVLAGRTSVRRVFEHPSFWSMAQTNLDNLEQGLERLSPEERETVTSQDRVEQTSDEDIEAMQEGRLDLDAHPVDDEGDTGRRRDDPPPPPDLRVPGRWG
ncbi:MAG: hypothetical protein ABIQ15_11110 [Nocardioides sp.]